MDRTDMANYYKHPDFASERSRLNTFENPKWDRTHRQTPQELAKFGFFFLGRDDCVCCYCCGLTLKFWQRGDDVAFSHARCRPECWFIRYMKGYAYMNQFKRSEEGVADGGQTAIMECNRCKAELIDITWLFLPCGHFTMCRVCSWRAKRGPTCDRVISNTLVQE